MSGPKEVAAVAIEHIEHLLSEMFACDAPDNEIALGTLLSGNQEIQVQLKITRNQGDFLIDDDAPQVEI
jgi:hypothetical protein